MNTSNIEEAAEKYHESKYGSFHFVKVKEIRLEAFKAGAEWQLSQIPQKCIDADTPLLQECFADNGEHSHWELIDIRTGTVIWSEELSQQPEIEDLWIKRLEGLPDMDKTTAEVNEFQSQQPKKEAIEDVDGVILNLLMEAPGIEYDCSSHPYCKCQSEGRICTNSIALIDKIKAALHQPEDKSNMKKEKRYIYKNHPEHPDTFEYVNKPDGYIINGLFYKDKEAVGNKGKEFSAMFEPIPVYFEPPDIIDVIGNCANCGVEFHIHKAHQPEDKEDGWISVEEEPKKWGHYLVYNPNGFGTEKSDVARFDNYNKNWYQGSDCIHPTHWQPLPLPPKASHLNQKQ